MIRNIAATALVALAAAGTAAAQDDYDDSAPASPALTFSYGFAVTSNYIDQGVTQSDDNPALQGYVEAGFGLFYTGVWASTVDFGGNDVDDGEFEGDQVEFDLTLGIRPTFGQLWTDLNYTRYLYDNSGDCCGEIIGAAGYPITDFAELAGEVDWDPEENTTWIEASLGLTFAEVWQMSGALGTDFGTEEWGERDKVAFDVGLGRSLGDIGTVDLRYYDSNYDDGNLVLTIGADF